MEIFNLKEMDVFFENCEHFKCDCSGINFICLSEYEYIIGKDKVYKLYLELPTDGKCILPPAENDNCYSHNPIRHLYTYDDIVDIDLLFKDGTKGTVKAYWGEFNVDEVNLYQHGKYEVDKKGNLTGKFILELFVEKLPHNIQEEVDKRKSMRDYIHENLWSYDPLEFKRFGKFKPVNVYQDEANVLTNYMYYNEETSLEKFRSTLFESIESQWPDTLMTDGRKEKLSDLAEFLYTQLTEGK